MNKMKAQKLAVIRVLFATHTLSLMACVDAVWEAADFSDGNARCFCTHLLQIAKGGKDLEGQLRKLELYDLMKFIKECARLADDCWYRDIPFLAKAIFGIERIDCTLVQVDQQGCVENTFLRKHELKRFFFKEVERLLHRS